MEKMEVWHPHKEVHLGDTEATYPRTDWEIANQRIRDKGLSGLFSLETWFYPYDCVLAARKWMEEHK